MTTLQLYSIFRRHPQITTDSRNCPEGSIFFALKGEKFNGNKFAAAALDNGCSYAVVDEREALPLSPPEGDDERFILVDDVLSTLQQLAHMHREQFRGPVIQITGTNGKTTTKELVSAVLSQKYNVLYTQGNLNNHIGVPLTLLRLTDDHDIAVIETGANHPGEIKALAGIVAPDYGLITNVGIAHIEGFGSFEGVVRTKGELYDYLRGKDENPESTKIFLNADNPYLARISEGLAAFTYGGCGHGCDVEGGVVECAPFLKLRWYYRQPLSSLCNLGGEYVSQCNEKLGSPSKPEGVADTCAGKGSLPEVANEVQTHLIGSYNIDNVLAAVSVGLYFGVEPKDIDKALADYVPTNNRSEMRRTDRNMLIVDAYNANPSSMKAALDNFSIVAAPEGMKKMLILGDMRELGEVSAREHKAVVDKLQEQGFDNVWLVGGNFRSLNPPYTTFADVGEVKAMLKDSPVEGYLILIKGSNGTRLYELPECL